MNDPSLNLSSEQELETRITALVLGEASAFEQDQIARLIEQRPELAELKARLEMVHGLLHDVGQAEWAGDETGEWKLPAKKRDALLAAMESESGAVVPLAVRPAPRITRFTKIASLVCAACLVVALGLWGMLGSRQASRMASRSHSQRDMSAGTVLEYSEDIAAEYYDVPAAALSRPSGPAGMGGMGGGMGGGEMGMGVTEGVVDMPAQDSNVRFSGSTASPSNETGKGMAAGNLDHFFGLPKDKAVTSGQTMKEATMHSPPAMLNYRSDDSKQGVPIAGDFGMAPPSVAEPQDSAETREYAGRALGRASKMAAKSEEPESLDGVPPSSGPAFSMEGDALGARSLATGGFQRKVPQSQTAAPAKPESGVKEQEEQALDFRASSSEQRFSRRRERSQLLEIVENEEAPMIRPVPGESQNRLFSNSLGDNLDFSEDIVRMDGTPQLQPLNKVPAADGYSLQLQYEPGKKLDALRRDTARREFDRQRAKLVPESNAATDPFSTFSLHVSDVSFKLAAAALAHGQWPDAAKVRIEEFVNALDYGDPLPSQHEKVSCQIEQCIDPFVQQRNLLRVSLRTAAAGRASKTPLRLTLLLDNSGSMERIDRQQTVRRAFATLAEQLQPNDQITLISFARTPRLLADRVSGASAKELVQLIENLPSDGGTNIEAALQLAWEKAREQWTEGAQNRIILLTDGAVNLGDANPERLANMITAIRDTGIAFDAAGISANGLNDEVLEALTRKGDGRYYLLDSAESADAGFARQIAGALRPAAMNVKVQVEFNPQRVGHYRLLGFEKHRLNKEDFRNDQVDAAEMAAAEAGVAVYQFEAKPDGEGDVGSVSVRFRDMSTGQMVERRWPIVYQTNPPRADQASVSMRLATVSAMFAAKLVGGPLGETVDLKTLSELIAGLPSQNRVANRVQQLEQMIQQARQISGQ